MPKIPALTVTQVVRALKKIGFVKDRQKGGHLVLIQPTILIDPRGQSRNLINDAKLSVEEFLKLI